MGKRRTRKTLVVCCLFALYLLIVAIAGEFLYRIIVDGHHRSTIGYDPLLVWTLKSDMRIDGKPFTNEAGFRDSFHPVQKPIGTTRIAVIGDSYTFGPLVARKDLFTSRLQEKFKNSSCPPSSPIEVLNFGVPAYATDQQYLLLREKVIRYSPDVVVVVSVPNDFRESYGKRLFTLNEGKWELNESNKAFHLPLYKQLLWKFSGSSELFFRFQELVGWSYGTYPYVFANVVEGIHFNEGDALGVDHVPFLDPRAKEMQEAESLVGYLLGQMNVLCQEHGCTMMIASLPTKMQFDGSLNHSRFDGGAVDEILKNIAKKNNIDFLSLYPAITRGNDPLKSYILTEYHLSEIGHAQVGDALFEHLSDKGDMPYTACNGLKE